MPYPALRLLAILLLAATPAAADRPDSVPQAAEWLAAQAKRMIRASRRTMADGTAAFPPQVGSHYDAFWLRDYAYTLEGCPEAFADKQLRDACLLFVRAQAADGSCVDCIKFDGTPIYKPGYGRMGENPVADGSQFTVDVAWHTWRRTGDRDLLLQVIGPLEKAMAAVPRNPQNGLVHIRPGPGWDRCPYGFTDTVRKQGDILFCSLLYVQAARQMADLLEAAGRPDDARTYRQEARRMAVSARKTFWDAELGLFRAATAQCREPDLWGSAFAVYLDVADQGQAAAVARYFQTHYDQITQHGQLRHLPGGVYWEKAGPRDQYQNGGYWATPVGWFVYTLDLADSKLADRAVLEMVADFQRRGVTEWCFGPRTAVPDYLASAAAPLPGIRRMLARRAAAADPIDASRR